MERTRKIGLNPTPQQQRRLARLAGYARIAYNWTLRHYRRTRDAGTPCALDQLLNAWKDARSEAYPWSDSFPQSAAKYAVYDLEKAIKAWKRNARQDAFPKPRRWRRRPSCRVDKGPDSVVFEGKSITLPVIGPIPTHRELGLTGSIRTVTAEREGGYWFACVTVRADAPEQSSHTAVVGIDVGARKIAACSDGTTYPVPKALRHQWGKIHRYREQLAQQMKGSARYRRTQRKLERATCRAADMREGAQHRAANGIVAGKRAVVLETLDTPDMMEKEEGRLERVIAAAAMRRMQRKIIYRCAAAGVEVIMAPPWLASSQTCSGCGNRKTGKMRLRDEEMYECHRCGVVIDRDENAAINLKHYGEERLGKRRDVAWSSQSAKKGRGDSAYHLAGAG